MIVSKKKILSNQGVEFSIEEGGNGPRKKKKKRLRITQKLLSKVEEIVMVFGFS